MYTTGGNDRVVEQWNGTGAILLRVISPPGTSELVDRSNQASATKLYEPLPLPRIPKERLAQALEHDAQAEERIPYEPFRDWGHDSLVFPQLSYDSTRGLLLGAYLQRTSYGFGLDPYGSQMNFGAAYATSLNRPRIEYGADFRTRSPLRGLLYVARRDHGALRLALADQLAVHRARLWRAQLGNVSLLRGGLSRRHAVAVASGRDRSDERERPAGLRPQPLRR